MTERRQLVLDFIRAYIKLHGVSPSMEIVARGIGLRSKSNICRIIHRLEADGHLQTRAGKYRSIKVVDKTVKAVESL